MLCAIAAGETQIENANQGADALATFRALRQLGVKARRVPTGFVVRGTSVLCDPPAQLDCGNSGTTMRLLMGLLAGRVNAVLDGDASLRRRPMERVAHPLRLMGADIRTATRGTPPVTLQRTPGELHGLRYVLPVASAQLKSALLLAGLRATGLTVLISRQPSRDHTERMLRSMHARISVRGNRIAVQPGELRAPRRIAIPGDFSGAFYLLAAAALLPRMCLRLRGVGLNPTRTAALTVARSMGLRVVIQNRTRQLGEPIGDLVVEGGAPLQGRRVASAMVPNLQDEIPALCALASVGHGEFIVRGAQELRVKESDRIATTVRLLRSFGVQAEALPDGIVVAGGGPLRAPRVVDTQGDHRIGMAAAILATAAKAPISISGADCIQTSFPAFGKMWRRVFARR